MFQKLVLLLALLFPEIISIFFGGMYYESHVFILVYMCINCLLILPKCIIYLVENFSFKKVLVLALIVLTLLDAVFTTYLSILLMPTSMASKVIVLLISCAIKIGLLLLYCHMLRTSVSVSNL